MKTFVVYKHPTLGYEAVKKGFSWPAFFFTWIWAISKYLWGPALAFIGINFVVLPITLASAPEGVAALFLFLLFIGIDIWFGLEGNEWRISNLKKSEYEYIQTVESSDPDEAIASVATLGASEAVQPPVVDPEQLAGFDPTKIKAGG
jgi:hypothetical protein